MQDHTSFIAISLDNLSTVTGGYHDPAGPAAPTRPDGPEGQPQGTAGGTLGSRLGAILNHFADLAAQAQKK